MDQKETVVKEIKKRGRPPLSEEEKKRRAEARKPVGRPKGSTKPVELKKPRKDNRPRKPEGKKHNGRSSGFSGYLWSLKFRDQDTLTFNTLGEIANYFGVSNHFIRQLKNNEWDVKNFRRYDRDMMEQFENLEDVGVQNVSQKYIQQIERDAHQDRLDQEQQEKEDQEFKLKLGIYVDLE